MFRVPLGRLILLDAHRTSEEIRWAGLGQQQIDLGQATVGAMPAISNHLHDHHVKFLVRRTTLRDSFSPCPAHSTMPRLSPIPRLCEMLCESPGKTLAKWLVV